MSRREIVGRYVDVEASGGVFRTFYESAGGGIPIVCLHTAGADGRQFHPLLTDDGLDGFRVIAFDLPYHGRSLPPDGWWRAEYQLTREFYRTFVLAFLDALRLDRPVILGCSMGGSMAIDLSVTAAARIRAAIALEACLYAPGRQNTYLHHPACHGSEVAASYSFGLNAPQSPEVNTRRNWWIYAQGAPGVYAGDLYFYSQDWDARTWRRPVDGASVLYLLTGEYDYSCLPEMTVEAGRQLHAERVDIMRGIGHFPMIENPPLLLDHLRPIIAEIRARG